MIKQDINIRGGGLWGGLLAYRMNQLFPEKNFLLFERQASLGGNHTWSFHESDVSKEALSWLTPFIVKSWPGYKVKFPKYEREFSGNYHTITSERFHELITDSVPKDRIRLNEPCPEAVECIDATGIFSFQSQDVAFQKFVGLHVELDEEHNLDLPILMDATVKQLDGFRFIYYLPLGPRDILIEDTYYSTSASLDRDLIRERLEEDIRRRGWKVKSIRRKEEGVLPLPLQAVSGVPMRNSFAGIFHDVTGYSLPDATRIIESILNEGVITYESINRSIVSYHRSRKSQRGYFQLLNRMMFLAAEPEKRYKVLQHFYKLPQPLVERFYKGEVKALDKIKIFSGKPPVPVLKAVRLILPSKRWMKWI